MKIGFFVQGTGDKAAPHYLLAKHLIESANKHMPDVEIHHLTDGGSPKIDGTVTRRLFGDMPMGVRRISHYAKCDGDWLFIDSDIVFKGNVEHVFNDDFDIALTDRIGTHMQGTPYAQVMPYNFGVVFSRCKDFWAAVKTRLLEMDVKAQQWAGEQFITGQMAHSGAFNVKILPGRKYNYPPNSSTDTDALVLHYKGKKKSFLLEAA